MRRLVLALALLIAAGCGDGNMVGPVPTPAPPRADILLAGDGEMWLVDADTERVRHVRDDRLSPGDPPHRVVRAGDDFLLWGYATYALEGGGGLRRIVDDSHLLFPSSRPGRAWVGVHDARNRLAMREVDVHGRTTVPGRHPPVGQWPVAISGHGIVFDLDGEALLWDPVTGAQRRLDVDGAVAQAGGDALLACREPCTSLELVDVRTGARRRVPAPGGSQWNSYAAAFSPRGDHLAALVHDGHPRLPHRLALVDVRSGDVRLVPGSEVPAGYVWVDWSAAGDQVFATGGDRFAPRAVVAHRIGEPRARRLAVAVGDFYDMAAR